MYSVLIRRKRLESSATVGRLLTAWEAGGHRARRLWLRLYDLRDALSGSS
jgi:hypothetical protein